MVEARREAAVLAKISGIGTASNQRVFLSIMFKLQEKPRSEGSGPTMSMCRTSKRESVGKGVIGGLIYLDVLCL